MNLDTLVQGHWIDRMRLCLVFYRVHFLMVVWKGLYDSDPWYDHKCLSTPAELPRGSLYSPVYALCKSF